MSRRTIAASNYPLAPLAERAGRPHNDPMEAAAIFIESPTLVSACPPVALPDGYYSVLVRYVSPALSTCWHPTVACGPRSVLSRGAFCLASAAHDWARANLNGQPYEVRYYL